MPRGMKDGGGGKISTTLLVSSVKLFDTASFSRTFHARSLDMKYLLCCVPASIIAETEPCKHADRKEPVETL